MEGEVEGVLAIGRSFGRLGLITNLAYGQDPEGLERDGEVKVAGLYALYEHVTLGLDSRLRFDLGTEADKLEEEGSAKYDLLTGPWLSYAFSDVALGAQAGLSVLGPSPSQRAAHLGALAMLTLSGSL